VTRYGEAYLGNALQLLDCLPDHSVDLVITSPPFALQRKKEYGNRDQDKYVDWLLKFAVRVHRVLKDTGSFILDLGGAYRKGRPVRSLYNYRVLIRLCDELGWNLAEEFFWFNPAKLPSPIKWVNKRKIRVKDAVNTVWWLSKTDFPKADVSRVLVPYSERMKRLLQNSESTTRQRKGHLGTILVSALQKTRAVPYLRTCYGFLIPRATRSTYGAAGWSEPKHIQRDFRKDCPSSSSDSLLIQGIRF